MIKHRGVYLVAASGVDGWGGSDTRYVMADKPLGPYGEVKLMSEQRTWGSQITSLFAVHVADASDPAARIDGKPTVLPGEYVGGGRGLDATRVDDLFEFRAGREMEDICGWIGAGRDLVGAGNRNELDVDLHGGERTKPPERSAATRGRATPADGHFCAH